MRYILPIGTNMSFASHRTDYIDYPYVHDALPLNLRCLDFGDKTCKLYFDSLVYKQACVLTQARKASNVQWLAATLQIVG